MIKMLIVNLSLGVFLSFTHVLASGVQGNLELEGEGARSDVLLQRPFADYWGLDNNCTLVIASHLEDVRDVNAFSRVCRRFCWAANMRPHIKIKGCMQPKGTLVSRSITDDIFLALLSSKKGIRSLYLSACAEYLSSFAIMQAVRQYPQLIALDIGSHSGRRERLLDILAKDMAPSFSGLLHLDLSFRSELSAATVLGFVQAAPRLQSLAITNCVRIKNVDLSIIFSHCSSLLHLSMSLHSDLTARAFVDAGKHMPHLREFCLTLATSNAYISPKLSPSKFVEILKQFPNLTALSIQRSFSAMTNDDLLGIVSNCSKLQVFDLSGSKQNLTIEGIVAATTLLPNLRVLLIDFQNIFQPLGPEDALKIIDANPRLEVFTFGNSDKLKYQTMSQLQKLRPNLKFDSYPSDRYTYNRVRK